MKKLFIVICFNALIISGAHAVDGTITFVGKVTDSTCSISNPGGANFNVNLPTVSKTTLAAVGSVAGRTPFKIILTQCSVGSVTAYFEPGVTTDLASGRLNNQSTGGAQNVQIQLLNSKWQPITIAAGVTPDGNQPNTEWAAVTTAGGGAELDYGAQYYATGISTAGAVSSSVQYTLIYK